MNKSQVSPAFDERHLQEHLRRRAPEMRRILEGQIPNSLRAQVSPDDILQEVWVAAFRTFQSFRAERSDSLDRWITSIANRSLIEKLRHAKTLKRGGGCHTQRDADLRNSSLANLATLVMAPDKTPSRVAASSEAAHAIHDALDTLPRPMREAIWMQYIEGIGRRAIAKAMHKSEAAVNALIFQGLQRLKVKLGASGRRFFSDVYP
jgi:RNA polymerase sigma factor (sigma-70 family)